MVFKLVPVTIRDVSLHQVASKLVLSICCLLAAMYAISRYGSIGSFSHTGKITTFQASKKKQNKLELTDTHSAKLHLLDALRTSQKDVLWTFLYGPLCNVKGRPLLTSWGRPLPTSLGRGNMASWGRPSAVLYVTFNVWDVPNGRLEDVSCRRYEDVPIRANI